MHPSYYPNGMPVSPSQQMAGFRGNTPSSSGTNPGQSPVVRPPFLQVDVSPFMNMQGNHLPSPTSYPPPPASFVMQRYPYSGQNSPSGSANLGIRPPPVFTGSNDSAIHDQTLRSLQERVAQIASIPRLTAQEVAAMNAQHITPRSMQGDNRMLMQEVTHLNPPGAARPFMQSKLTSSSSSSSIGDLMQQQGRHPQQHTPGKMFMSQQNMSSPGHSLLPMPPPPMKAATSPSSSSSSRYIGPTEEELRKLNELMPTGDDPDSKKSVEEWKRFRLRVMSRLRKQRWRAKKKAEVLAGIEDTQREEAERKRRDRLRKQEQRAKKKQRQMEESSSNGDEEEDEDEDGSLGTDSQDGDNSSPGAEALSSSPAAETASTGAVASSAAPVPSSSVDAESSSSSA